MKSVVVDQVKPQKSISREQQILKVAPKRQLQIGNNRETNDKPFSTAATSKSALTSFQKHRNSGAAVAPHYLNQKRSSPDLNNLQKLSKFKQTINISSQDQIQPENQLKINHKPKIKHVRPVTITAPEVLLKSKKQISSSDLAIDQDRKSKNNTIHTKAPLNDKIDFKPQIQMLLQHRYSNEKGKENFQMKIKQDKQQVIEDTEDNTEPLIRNLNLSSGQTSRTNFVQKSSSRPQTATRLRGRSRGSEPINSLFERQSTLNKMAACRGQGFGAERVARESSSRFFAVNLNDMLNNKKSFMTRKRSLAQTMITESSVNHRPASSQNNNASHTLRPSERSLLFNQGAEFFKKPANQNLQRLQSQNDQSDILQPQINPIQQSQGTTKQLLSANPSHQKVGITNNSRSNSPQKRHNFAINQTSKLNQESSPNVLNRVTSIPNDFLIPRILEYQRDTSIFDKRKHMSTKKSSPTIRPKSPPQRHTHKKSSRSPSLVLRRIQSNESEEKQATLLDNLNLIMRVRPLIGLEQSCQKELTIAVDSNQNQVKLINDQKIQSFDAKRCFGPEIDQNVFYSSVQPLAKKFVCSLKNCALVTYGQTGSGKTFTLYGTSLYKNLDMSNVLQQQTKASKNKSNSRERPSIISPLRQKVLGALNKEITVPINPQLNRFVSPNQARRHQRKSSQAKINTLSIHNFKLLKEIGKAEDLGIVPRLIFDIFSLIRRSRHDEEIICSSVQIYNEDLFDLLNESDSNLSQNSLKMKNVAKSDTTEQTCSIPDVIIEGQTKHRAINEWECLALLRQAEQNKITRLTARNQDKLRSNSIFTLELHRNDKVVSKLQICDLGGSEEITVEEKKGARIIFDLKKITASITGLGKVVTAMCQGSPNIPYRDSKVTRLLAESILGPKACTYLISCLSPAKIDLKETERTLNFASNLLDQKQKRVEYIKELARELRSESPTSYKEWDPNSGDKNKITNIECQLTGGEQDPENMELMVRRLLKENEKLRKQVHSIEKRSNRSKSPPKEEQNFKDNKQNKFNVPSLKLPSQKDSQQDREEEIKHLKPKPIDVYELTNSQTTSDHQQQRSLQSKNIEPGPLDDQEYLDVMLSEVQSLKDRSAVQKMIQIPEYYYQQNKDAPYSSKQLLYDSTRSNQSEGPTNMKSRNAIRKQSNTIQVKLGDNQVLYGMRHEVMTPPNNVPPKTSMPKDQRVKVLGLKLAKKARPVTPIRSHRDSPVKYNIITWKPEESSTKKNLNLDLPIDNNKRQGDSETDSDCDVQVQGLRRTKTKKKAKQKQEHDSFDEDSELQIDEDGNEFYIENGQKFMFDEYGVPFRVLTPEELEEQKRQRYKKMYKRISMPKHTISESPEQMARHMVPLSNQWWRAHNRGAELNKLTNPSGTDQEKPLDMAALLKAPKSTPFDGQFVFMGLQKKIQGSKRMNAADAAKYAGLKGLGAGGKGKKGGGRAVKVYRKRRPRKSKVVKEPSALDNIFISSRGLGNTIGDAALISSPQKVSDQDVKNMIKARIRKFSAGISKSPPAKTPVSKVQSQKTQSKVEQNSHEIVKVKPKEEQMQSTLGKPQQEGQK